MQRLIVNMIFLLKTLSIFVLINNVVLSDENICTKDEGCVKENEDDSSSGINLYSKGKRKDTKGNNQTFMNNILKIIFRIK